MGMGTKREEERLLCSFGLRVGAAVRFNPYFFVTAEVNEKMGEMLVKEIVPELLKLHPVSEERKQRMESCPEEPVFTLVFDREAYSPVLFAKLWDDYRIAVITYRKNVKDKWEEELFDDYWMITKEYFEKKAK